MLQPGRTYQSSDYRYGFGGQEKDDEIAGVGNSYTAEYWQYDSRLGRRWNTDPVVKIHESPYAAFANNPIWFIDPTGADTVEVLEGSGNIMNHVEATGEDYFVMVNKEGQRLEGQSLSLRENSLEKIESRKDSLGKGQTFEYDYLVIRGDDNAAKLFEFLAKNTIVEWSQTMVGSETGAKGENYLSTSHEQMHDKGILGLLNRKFRYGWVIREHIHNHPSGFALPSGMIETDEYKAGTYGDIRFVKSVEDWYVKQYPDRAKPIFKVYSAETKKYTQYDKNSTTADFPEEYERLLKKLKEHKETEEPD